MMNQNKLSEVLRLHKKWLVGEIGGRSANLQCANLQCANLQHANLQHANLQHANLQDARLNWANWHEAAGIKIYVAGLQSSRENAQLTYISNIDIATTGCFQSTWEKLKSMVSNAYKDDDPKIFKKYQLAIGYIEAQMKQEEMK